MADTAVNGAYRFGPFHLDVRERLLSRGGEVIPLRLKVFGTLVLLVENAGRLVTKQELLDRVWPETTVEENNLNQNVSVLRKALGERAPASSTSNPSRTGATGLLQRSKRRSRPTGRRRRHHHRRPQKRVRKSGTAPPVTASDSPTPPRAMGHRW